jgi:hypothetical protein
MADKAPVKRSFRWLFSALLGVASLEALLWLLRRSAGL